MFQQQHCLLSVFAAGGSFSLLTVLGRPFFTFLMKYHFELFTFNQSSAFEERPANATVVLIYDRNIRTLICLNMILFTFGKNKSHSHPPYKEFKQMVGFKIMRFKKSQLYLLIPSLGLGRGFQKWSYVVDVPLRLVPVSVHENKIKTWICNPNRKTNKELVTKTNSKNMSFYWQAVWGFQIKKW